MWLWLRPTPSMRVESPGRAVTQPAPVRPSVHVDAAILRRYAGKYDVDGLVVEIRVEGERLIVDAGAAGRFVLRAASETRFFFEGLPGEMAFESGDPAPHFVAHLADDRYRGTRIRE